MRLVSSLALICALFAGASAVSAVPTFADDCGRTEQSGCLEIDILNFRYDAEVASLAEADQGQSLYYRYKKGYARSAGNQCYYVYFWHIRDVSANDMSEYHIIGRDGKRPYRTEVEEVDPFSGPTIGTEYEGIGNPHRAFRVCGDAAVMAFQFPYEMITGKTYVLICAERVTVVPGKNRGEWLTPKILASIVQNRHEYWFAPFVHG